MKVCLGQINTTPGDFAGNLEKVRLGIEAASKAQADLVVFPELTLPGYLSQDLIYNPDFIECNLQALQEVVEMSRYCNPGLHIVIGYIGKNTGVGKPFTNLAGVINQGRLIHIYQKQLLPFYDVFDELRYFEPGNELTVFNIGSVTVGLAICEDLWNDKGSDDYHTADNPLQNYRAAGVDVLVSINSSPFVHGKCQQRLEQIVPATSDGPAIVYVNQCGGQDELVFDGQSFVADLGAVRYLSSTIFNDSFDLVEIFDDTRVAPELVETETVPLADLLVLGLRDYVKKSGFSQIVLASSGGVDSAVVCKLACDAVGAENVHAIRMPSIFSSPHSRDDAKLLHENLGCWDYEVPIEHESLVQNLNEHFSVHTDSANIVVRKTSAGGYSAVADENIQARLRDVYLMHFSNAYGAMPLSTGNKTESGCGYYTHFDMNFSYAPIKDLYKFEVVDLASSDTRIPENIWRKPPSAELAVGQTDEESLLPYALLDPIVMSYVEDYVTSFERFRAWVATPVRQKITGNMQTLMDWLDREGAVNDYERIVSLIGRMEYKRRQTCPGTKVSKVAFGIGRRIPIVEKWS
jgi:NAD+ synthase (glutamine-hydrolysing)